jgi:hypothetical protein
VRSRPCRSSFCSSVPTTVAASWTGSAKSRTSWR